MLNESGYRSKLGVGDQSPLLCALTLHERENRLLLLRGELHSKLLRFDRYVLQAAFLAGVPRRGLEPPHHERDEGGR